MYTARRLKPGEVKWAMPFGKGRDLEEVPMKSKSLLVAFSLCMIWAQRAAHADEFDYCSLSFMTFNIQAAIHLGPAEPGLEKIAQVIETAGKPDVLMLQEVMRFDPLVDNIDEFQWLKDRLGYPYG